MKIGSSHALYMHAISASVSQSTRLLKSARTDARLRNDGIIVVAVVVDGVGDWSSGLCVCDPFSCVGSFQPARINLHTPTRLLYYIRCNAVSSSRRVE
jgi:hypothetical protein